MQHLKLALSHPAPVKKGALDNCASAVASSLGGCSGKPVGISGQIIYCMHQLRRRSACTGLAEVFPLRGKWLQGGGLYGVCSQLNMSSAVNVQKQVKLKYIYYILNIFLQNFYSLMLIQVKNRTRKPFFFCRYPLSFPRICSVSVTQLFPAQV